MNRIAGKAHKSELCEDGWHSAPLIFDDSDGQELRINTIGSFLKKRFGRKVVKLSLDAGLTCPNRDGSKGYGGCAFCSASGSGDTANGSGDIKHDLECQIELLSRKWPHAKYIAYFQGHTNTYAPVEFLRENFTAALRCPNIVGLAVATRPDCLPKDVLDLLSSINDNTFLWVELGLQTIHESTQRNMNLCYTTADYDEAVRELIQRGIRVVPHLILGLPGETPELMSASVRHVCMQDIFGLKLHMFNLVRGSQMEKMHPNYISFNSIDEYIDTLLPLLELIPPDVVLHRISGDAPRHLLIAPEWSYKKRTILNEIHRAMRERNSWQGKNANARL